MENNKNSIAGVGTAAVTTSTNQQSQPLLSACWRSPDRAHFIGTLDRRTGKFKNIPVKDAVEAANFAMAYSAMGLDAYFACAEFASPDSRTSQNAAGAWAFFADIDVGADKAATDKGYSTVEGAQAALKEFCTKTDLPESTHIVNSGSGIHCYWPFDAFLEREQWLEYAAKFKALMKALDLRADPSRTADIASVLRVPGTLNFKTTPPRPVTVLSSADGHIDLAVMLDAIDAAVVKYGVVAEKTATTNHEPAAPSLVPFPVDYAFAPEPPNLLQLTSALKSLDPDCDERTWKFHRIAPMAYGAREIPELNEVLYGLVKQWSSGELRGLPSVKWNTAGNNGLTGAQYFDRVWNRFLTDNYAGKRVTIATIFFHAKAAGWSCAPKQDEIADDNGEDAA